MDISILHICTHRSEIKAPPHVRFRRVLEMNEVLKGKDYWKRSVAVGNIYVYLMGLLAAKPAVHPPPPDG